MRCKLVFVLPENRLSPDVEKSRYDLHNNDPNDPRYRNFLNRLFIPIREKLKAGSHGLDFGSGPGPTLSIMLEEAGHQVSLYDSFYAPDLKVFGRQYDFITASEVIEHLHEPLSEMERLWTCLKPGGWMGIMTTRLPAPEAFHNWYYKNDDTHVCFYSLETFEWLAEHLGAKMEDASPEVVLLQKR